MVHKKNQKQRARVEQTTLAMQAIDKEVQDRIKFGAPVEKKSNSQLYFVDKKGGKTTSSSSNNEYLTKSEKMLASNPNIDIMSHDTKHENEDKKAMTPVEKKFLKHVTNVKKEKSLLPSKQAARRQRSNSRLKSMQLWGDEDNNGNNNEEDNDKTTIKINKKVNMVVDKNNDFITPNLLENRIKKPKKLVNHPSVINKVSNIEIAEPGMSYNPSYEDHQDTLGVAAAKEFKALDYIENIDKILNPDQLDYQEAAHNSVFDQDEEQQTEAMNEDYNKKPGERITKLEKNKRIRRAEEMKRQKLAMEKKLFNQQIDSVLDTLKEVEEDIEVAKKLKVQRNEKKKLNSLPKRLGKYKFTESQEPILLTDELPKSLSTLSNNHYNPLKDRYQHLQKRHVIEASGPQMKPVKAYRKVYTSNSWNNTTVASLD